MTDDYGEELLKRIAQDAKTNDNAPKYQDLYSALEEMYRNSNNPWGGYRC